MSIYISRSFPPLSITEPIGTGGFICSFRDMRESNHEMKCCREIGSVIFSLSKEYMFLKNFPTKVKVFWNIVLLHH